MARLSQQRVERERGLARVAERQQGMVGRWQLLRMGFGEEAIRVLLATARLIPVHREVFCVGHRRTDRAARWWAAVLAYGPMTVLSHRSAAAFWGIANEGRRPVDVTAPRGRQGVRRRTGIWVHRCRLEPVDLIADGGGIPTTTVARTLFDLAELEPIEFVRDAAAEADRLKLPWALELAAVCERGRGRRALRPVRRLLADLPPADEGRSPLELRFPPFCRAHAVPLPVQNATVLGHEVDCLWPAAKLIAELDGWQYHRHRAAFERDRVRDSRLLLAGYRVIRITHRRLGGEPEALAAEIRGLLASPDR